MSSFFDELLPGFNSKAEEDAVGGPELVQLPSGIWAAFKFADDSTDYHSRLDEPNPERGRTWHQLVLVMTPIGAEEKVPQKTYSRVTVYPYIDEKETPGVPSKQLRGLINTVFGAGFEKGSAERAAAARATLDEVVKETGWDLTDETLFPTPAVAVAAVFAKAVTLLTPSVIGKTYTRKGKEYTDRETGEVKTSKDRFQIGNYEDYTPENLAKRGIVVWGEAEKELNF